MKKTALMASVAFGMALVCQARAGENAAPGADIAPYIDLKTVREHPTAYQATPFQFDGQFYSIGTLFSPFYSVFEAGRYLNFSVWDDTEELWTSHGYTSAYPLLYLSRARTNDVGKLTKCQRFDRFHATAIVRATVGSFAFIEVLSIEPLERKITPLALHHMIRGYRHKAADEFDLAAVQFADAFDDGLPEHVLALV